MVEKRLSFHRTRAVKGQFFCIKPQGNAQTILINVERNGIQKRHFFGFRLYLQRKQEAKVRRVVEIWMHFMDEIRK